MRRKLGFCVRYTMMISFKHLLLTESGYFDVSNKSALPQICTNFCSTILELNLQRFTIEHSVWGEIALKIIITCDY